MNVLLVSECSKNALRETRRILDQFAERRGARTWQTAITNEGLDTLRRLLRKTARKNTAVACHWIRGKNRSELMWIVGNASRFNSRGAVPTDTTEKNIVRAQDENDWKQGAVITLLTAIAALFHDLGKATKRFQDKLEKNAKKADPIRHEWVSLRLLQAFVGDDDDREWVARLADFSGDTGWIEQAVHDGLDRDTDYPFKKLPPLAQAVGWLMVTHHRLPVHRDKPVDASMPNDIAITWNSPCFQGSAGKEIKTCWLFDAKLLSSTVWQARARKIAGRVLKHDLLFSENWLGDPYVMHVSRLMLVLADHHYSSLRDEKKRFKGDDAQSLYANTIRSTGEKKSEA